METCVCREDQETTSLFTPTDVLSADDRLHDSVKATFRGVQITGHCCSLHFTLVNCTQVLYRGFRKWWNFLLKADTTQYVSIRSNHGMQNDVKDNIFENELN
jgi:hypothetical protein